MKIQKKYTEMDRLEHKINQLREEMIQSAAATGLNSHRTIYYSQKLDKLIIIYQKHFYYYDSNEEVFHDDKIV
ncbi:Spo0E family sporulation regulatory protein-aspartic acid phosphatase [Niallia oryzisoli]|uniref:Spo0E family sporulation regulatory protein-aspartic acid phosphatase n=1 Tax=Niallia oryzisoli TaxID=1737571 RepID=UPI003735427F